MRLRAFSVIAGIAFLLACVNIVSARPTLTAESTCIQPNVDKFLEDRRVSIDASASYIPSPTAMYLSEQVDGQNRQWMGTRWYGAPGGVLFLLDCSGNEIARAQLGPVEDLQAGPVVPAGRTIAVIYNSEYGTGVLGSSVALMRYQEPSVRILWQHETKEEVSQPSFGDEYYDLFHWTISPDGKRISVTGQRKVGSFKDRDHGWAPGTTHALPNESYCWSDSKETFLKCD